MTLRRRVFAPALIALLLTAGCADNRTPTAAEIDEPYFREGHDLKRQGRTGEALTAFLKVIEKRGLLNAPESHQEVGLIYLDHSKDPIAAIYHFRQYLNLRPNARDADLVNDRIETAKREFARTLPARPMEDQSVRMEMSAEVDKLQRENEELRAQLATLRGGGAAPVYRPARANAAPEPARSRNADPAASNAFTATLPPRTAPADEPIIMPAPAQPPASPRTPAPKASPPAGRTHTVAPKDTLYSISVRYYGNGRHVEEIFSANRDQMKSTTDLRIGMVIRIP